ncbi:hypothetical protein [Shinella zoogloeoides]|uniref:hypothetical protein n=1 Tax=Shinella zoogloeoides TaxID=352475 RepID=UPI00273EE6EA|nr:hypothetical protein [Shinella zoogloeoides]WLR95360.1 hypothetical protein Q9316_24515 [Shinella zoogloeoides]
MKKIIIFLTTIMTVVGGITTANSQSARSESPTQHATQLVQKKKPGRHILNGHQGVKERRKGYRRHSDGYWYPPGAFADKSRGKDNLRDRKSLSKRDLR